MHACPEPGSAGMKCAAALIMLLAMAGCASTYTLLYDTRARFERPPNDPDSLLQLEINPVPNGILLHAFNLSGAPVQFEWDRSYIVWPSGETQGVRCLGFWELGQGTATTTGPTNTVAFKRHANALISAGTYANALDTATVAAICRDWRRRGDRGGWPESLYRVGSYWPTQITTAKHGSANCPSMGELRSFVQSNDHLELVVAYQERGVARQCRVVVWIHQIDAVAVHSRAGQGEIVEIRQDRQGWVYEARSADWRKRQ